MRNAPRTLIQIPNIARDRLIGNRLANAYMLLAVALFSALPLIIAWGGGGKTPFLFNAAMSAGVILGCLVFIAYRYPSLLFNANILRLVARRAIDHRIVLSIAANFNFAFLAWSTRFVDVSISAIMFGTWPIFIVIIHDRLYKHEERYHRLSPEILLLIAFGLLGFAFIIVGQAGGFQSVETGRLAELIIGVVLAALGAIATACNAFGFRWGTDLAQEISDADRPVTSGDESDQDEAPTQGDLDFLGLLVALLIASAVSGLLNTVVGVSSGEVMESRSLFIAIIVGGAASGIANAAWRKANLNAHHAGVNALAFAAPVFSLAWLFLLTQTQPENLDYLIIGIIGIVIVNLLINSEAEVRFGFKALLLALWTCGAFVYLRDDLLQYLPFGEWQWPGETYFGALGLSATVFTLLRSFRVARLSTQTQEEDNRLYTLFQNVDLLARRDVIDQAAREHVIDIDKAVTPEQLKDAYESAKDCLDRAEAANPDPDDQVQLAEAETQLNVIAHSRQQGIEFGELFALIIFGGITVFIGMASRPGVTGWIGFLVEMLVVLFSAVIVFLIINVWDLHRDRAGDILEEQQYQDHDGAVFYEGYGVVFRDAVSRRLEQTTSIVIGLLVTIAYGALLWYKWLP